MTPKETEYWETCSRRLIFMRRYAHPTHALEQFSAVHCCWERKIKLLQRAVCLLIFSFLLTLNANLGRLWGKLLTQRWCEHSMFLFKGQLCWADTSADDKWVATSFCPETCESQCVVMWLHRQQKRPLGSRKHKCPSSRLLSADQKGYLCPEASGKNVYKCRMN